MCGIVIEWEKREMCLRRISRRILGAMSLRGFDAGNGRALINDATASERKRAAPRPNNLNARVTMRDCASLREETKNKGSGLLIEPDVTPDTERCCIAFPTPPALLNVSALAHAFSHAASPTRRVVLPDLINN